MFQDIHLNLLSKLFFFCFSIGWLNILSKPMPKVKSILLEACDLSDKSISNDYALGAKALLLREIFPKLNHMKIRCHNKIIMNFPYLKELEIKNIYNCELPEIKSFLNLNPKSSSCVYDNGYIWKFVQFIAEKSHLEKLELHLVLSPNKHIIFKQLKHLIYMG